MGLKFTQGGDVYVLIASVSIRFCVQEKNKQFFWFPSDLFQLKCDLPLNEIVPLILAVVSKGEFCLSEALMVWLVKKFWMSVAIIF